MVIGIFHRIEDGFAGQLFCMGLNDVPIAVVPSPAGKTYSLLIARRDIPASVAIGTAVRKPDPARGHLEVRIDGPLLPRPVTATMKLRPSLEGIYTLVWTRP